MAKIKIRGRLDPIELDNVRARKVKERKFGTDTVEKAEATDTVDLGDWAGEYGRIVEIEMTKEHQYPEDLQDKYKREEEEHRKKWLAMSAKEKTDCMGRFKLSYGACVGDYKAEVPAKVLTEAKKRLLKFFTKNPKAMGYGDQLEDLLPEKSPPTLAESMDMNRAVESNGRKCKKCGTDLTGNLLEYCSGKCQLEDINGELSTG